MTDKRLIEFYNELSKLAKEYQICIVMSQQEVKPSELPIYFGSPAGPNESINIRVLKNRDKKEYNENRTCFRYPH